MKSLGIIGMGRVGLTLALTLASQGFKILGVEREKAVVTTLNRGEPHFYEKGLKPLLKKQLESGSLKVVNQITEKQEAYIISVGTPINKLTKKVILEPLLNATREVSGWIEEGDLVILRSTVPVGATRNIVLPILKERREHLHLAFCPERTIEGKALLELKELPQIVGGLDEESVEKAVSIFSRVTATTVRVDSLEAAEFIKLIDNTSRDASFAFANEVAFLAGRFGIDGFKLIKAANYGYPRNNIPIPGFVGGACLAKDPYILYESVLETGYKAKIPLIAREINEGLIGRLAEKIEKEMASIRKDIKGVKIFLLGMAFKGEPETDDLRDSPAVDLARFLKEKMGCTKIFGHDYVASPQEISGIGVIPCSLEEGFRGADCAVLMNSHRTYGDLDLQLLTLMNKPALFFDGWHLFDPEEISKNSGITYRMIGDE